MKMEQLAEIVKANPRIDPTAIDRSRQAAKQLAEVGIELGGHYRIVHPLDRRPLRKAQQAARRDQAAKTSR